MSKRTKPLRIKAAHLLTSSWLRSTMRSIFKHNIHCSIFPLRFSGSLYHTAWIKTPLKSTVRAVRTNKHANTQRIAGPAYEIHMDACWRVCAQSHKCVLKAWSKRPLLETIGLKCCCSRAWARLSPLLTLFFLFLSSVSILSPVPRNQPPSPTIQHSFSLCTNSGFSTLLAVLLSQHSSSGLTMCFFEQ